MKRLFVDRIRIAVQFRIGNDVLIGSMLEKVILDKVCTNNARLGKVRFDEVRLGEIKQDEIRFPISFE